MDYSSQTLEFRSQSGLFGLALSQPLTRPQVAASLLLLSHPSPILPSGRNFSEPRGPHCEGFSLNLLEWWCDLLDPSMLWMSFKSVQVIYSSASKMTGTASQMKRLSQIPGMLWKPLSLRIGEKGWTFYWFFIWIWKQRPGHDVPLPWNESISSWPLYPCFRTQSLTIQRVL